MRILSTLYLFFSLIFFGYSQEANIKNGSSSEIVFLKDCNLKKVIKKIVTDKTNDCNERGANWYIDFMKDNFILVSKNTIRNLIISNEIDKIYTTVLDDNILFILNSDSTKDSFDKTGYSLDLSSSIGKMDYSTVDYSFWIIQKTDSKKHKIVKEKKYNRN